MRKIVLDEFWHLLRRVAESVTAAQANYQVWFTLKGEGKALPEYYNDMNDGAYVDFFHVINAGTYKLMFIELGCLFDTDDRSSSIRNLKKSLREIGRDDLATKLELGLKDFSHLVSNILTIRSKLMAHKELGCLSEDVHATNEVIPDGIGHLIRKCAVLVNEINSEIFDMSGILMCSVETMRYENATFNMLQTLQKGRS